MTLQKTDGVSKYFIGYVYVILSYLSDCVKRFQFCFNDTMENSVFYTDLNVSDESVSGNSQWYVVLEQPLPIIQQAAGSPVPPPRQRHNPFNKPEAPHQRSHSLRSAPGTSN